MKFCRNCGRCHTTEPTCQQGKFMPTDVIPVDVDPIRSPGQFSFERVVH